MKANLKLTAVFEKTESGGYIGFVEEISGVNTQGETLEEARGNLMEALELVLETQRHMMEEDFKGRQVIRERIDLSDNEAA